MAGKAPDPDRMPCPEGAELLSGPPALRYIAQCGTLEDRHRRFAAVTGIDWRLWILVPLAMALAALALSVALAVQTGRADRLLEGWLFLMDAALSTMLFTLPPALLCWVAVRALCWKAGLSERMASIVAGAVAGWGATGFALIGTPLPAVAWMSVPCAAAGAAAAATVYWRGWRNAASGQP